MTPQPHLGTVRLPPLANNRDEVLWPVVMDLAAELPKPPFRLERGKIVHNEGWTRSYHKSGLRDRRYHFLDQRTLAEGKPWMDHASTSVRCPRG